MTLYRPPIAYCAACGATETVRLAHTASQANIEGFCPTCGASHGTCLPEPEPGSLNFWERPDYPVHPRLCGCKHCKRPKPEPEDPAPTKVVPFRVRLGHEDL